LSLKGLGFCPVINKDYDREEMAVRTRIPGPLGRNYMANFSHGKKVIQ
jgi:hypothetical protein